MKDSKLLEIDEYTTTISISLRNIFIFFGGIVTCYIIGSLFSWLIQCGCSLKSEKFSLNHPVMAIIFGLFFAVGLIVDGAYAPSKFFPRVNWMKIKLTDYAILEKLRRLDIINISNDEIRIIKDYRRAGSRSPYVSSSGEQFLPLGKTL